MRSSPTPRVSVLMTFLNGAEFLAEALASIRAQTFADWELLLVDDGSTDASVAVAQATTASWPQPVRLLHHPGHQNRGMSASRNLALRHARGEFVALLDADDVYEPHALARMVARLAAAPAALVGGNALRWYSWTGHPADQALDYAPRLARFGLPALAHLPPPRLLELLLQDPTASPPTCAVLLRRAALRAVGGFEDEFRTLYEDQAAFSKLSLRYPVVLSDEVWARYRRHDGSVCAAEYRGGTEDVSRRAFLAWLRGYLTRHPALGTPALRVALAEILVA